MIKNQLFSIISLGISILGIFLLAGCDHDEKFEIVTDRSYLLLQKDSTNEKELWYFSPKDKSFTLANEPINNSNLSEISGRDNEICYGDKKEKQVIYQCFKVKNSGEIKEEITKQKTAGYTPNFVAMGNDYICFSDSNQQVVGFLVKGKEGKEAIIRKLDVKPLQICYAVGKFYIIYSNGEIGIWEESALSQRNKVAIKGQFLGFSPSQNRMEVFSHKNDSILQANISYESLVLSNTRLSSFRTLKYSLVSRKVYGNEWLKNAGISTNNCLLTDINVGDTLARNVSSFAIDFSQSIIYYTKEKQLYVQAIGSSDFLAVKPINATILQTFFRQGYKN